MKWWFSKRVIFGEFNLKGREVEDSTMEEEDEEFVKVGRESICSYTI